MNKTDYLAMSRNNSHLIDNDTECGCYFCVETFKGSDIQLRTDNGKTVLCPRCEIDSVLPEITDKILLRVLCGKYFTGKHDE